MKALIVDDEKLTRSGLLSSIDWHSLGIEDVCEASNGIEGLQKARTEKPDIVLTDMRMPRMDGATMAEKLRETLPDTAIIFMSGYTDKEYLKAAIHLKAVSYVEKPLDTSEVTEAIRLAAKELLEKGLVKRSLTEAITEHGNRLAEIITRAPAPDTFKDISLPDSMHADDYFTSIILQFAGNSDMSLPDIYRTVRDHLNTFFERRRLKEVHIIKENGCLCYFVYGSRTSGDSIPSLCRDIKLSYLQQGLKYIAIGDTVHGIYHAYNSYSSAVILLQEAFFCEAGTILSNSEDLPQSPSIIKDLSPDFQIALESGNRASTDDILKEVRLQFKPPCRLLASQVKDIYYQLFLTLQKAMRHSQMAEIMLKGRQSIWDMVENADSLDILHGELVNCTEEYFEGLSTRDSGSNMVFSIKEFIRHNFQNESLSIKSVSDHVNRSAPYVCTVFKAETGLTLNQYITGYRIERAQEMLSDPRYKITDVAARVGYTDVNYFGKIFKKITNVSPSEFRGSFSSVKESSPS